MKTREEIKQIAIHTIQAELDALKSIQLAVNEDFASVVELILATKGRVVITGIGKSAIIANKIVSTLNSTGTPAIFMHAADAIHGDKPQHKRQRVLAAFKMDQIKILVATDVAARGLDVADITHVINYDQPNNYDDYCHRIGRTGRGDKKGYALTFVE